MPRITTAKPTKITAKPYLLIPIAALCAIVPLLLQGPSCGHDEVFHLQSWLDASTQLRAGTLFPHWAISPAWNAGEPRFLFYPPISWLLGEFLTLLAPIQAVPVLFIWIALTTAGLAFYKFIRELFDTPNQISPNAALLASALYLANPYMLFNAYERSAFAELLAAAWIPLLLLAILRKRPTIPGLAIPIALLWLTNAPAAVMGCYILALLATLRVIFTFFAQPKKPVISTEASRLHAMRSGETPVLAFRLGHPKSLTLTYIAGTALGLTLPAFYLLPAAYQQRYVQVAMAIIPNMRFQDNFIFSHNTYAFHNFVTHQVSLIGLTLLLLTTATLSTLLLLDHRDADSRRPTLSSILYPLSSAVLLIALLLVPISTPIWNHLPKLAFLQFPWRLLTILAPITALTLALLLNRRRPSSFLLSTVYCLLSAFLLSGLGTHHFYGQHCEANDGPRAVAQLFHTHHGAGPTDEYTPTAADNDVLRTDNPPFWLAQKPNDPAPNTVPTPTELNPNIDTDDTPIPTEQTLSTPTPHHFHIHAPTPGYLILNLREYPNWDITETDTNSLSLNHPTHNLRDDGLTAITLYYPSDYTIDIHWHRTPDQNLGLAITILALLALILTLRYHSST